MEEGNLRDSLHLELPLYGLNFEVTPENAATVAFVVPLFLCPSDHGRPVSNGFGPTNYVACAGTGNGGGTPVDTDGVFYVNSHTRMAQIADGASHTVLFAESLLGNPKGTPITHDVEIDYKFAFSAPLTAAGCDNSAQWNVSDPRGFSWASGEYRCALYNHAYLPNQRTADCMGAPLGGGSKWRYTAYGCALREAIIPVASMCSWPTAQYASCTNRLNRRPGKRCQRARAARSVPLQGLDLSVALDGCHSRAVMRRIASITAGFVNPIGAQKFLVALAVARAVA